MSGDLHISSYEPESSEDVGVGSSVEAPANEISGEERLRQEAAKRLERRRRKMMSPEERLAKITGLPVEAVAPCCSDVVFRGESNSASEVLPQNISHNDDPPLEHLTRDPFTSDTSTMEGEFLTNMLGGQGASPPSDPVKYSQSVWLYLALAVRLMLETQYSWILGNNMVAPFVVMISVLMTTGYLSIANLATSSLLTAGTSLTFG